MFSFHSLTTQQYHFDTKNYRGGYKCIHPVLSQSTGADESFKTESNLVNILESLLAHRKRSSESGFIKEFDCSNGIADVVLFELRKGWEKHTTLGEIPSRWAFALYQLPYRKTFTTSEFAKTAGVTKRRASVALHQYANLGFCDKKIDKELWIKNKQPRPITNKIYAVEAKLRDWKRALSQAYRYLEYANQSWVVMDYSCAKSAVKNIAKFRRLNVGLASLKTDGMIVIHFTPTESSPKSQLKFWQANSEIASRITSSNIS